jgi:tetratricopeptide (TPR) repeat protein
MAGDPAAVVRYFEESLALYRLVGDPSGIGYALIFLGGVKFSVSIEERDALLQEAIAIYRQTKNPWGLQLALVQYAGNNLIFTQGKFNQAEPFLLECEQICSDNGIPGNTALALVFHSLARLGSGNYVEARQISATALKISRENSFPRIESLALNYLGWSLMAQSERVEALGCCRQGAALARGDYMPLNERALTLAGLAAAACLNGSMEEAKRCLLETLEVIKSLGSPKLLFWTLPPLAALLAAQGEAERAVELYSMAHAISPFIENAKFIEDIFGSQVQAAAASLPPEVCAAAEVRGRARDQWDTVRELLEELQE